MNRVHKDKFLFLIIQLCFIFILTPFQFDKNIFGEKTNKIIDDFEDYKIDIFEKWLLRSSTIDEAMRIYKIKTSSNNKFLHAESYGTSIQIAKKVNWELKHYPVISWRWRAIKLPEGANESKNKTNDSAAGIYIIFPRFRIPFLPWKYHPINVIKYVWSKSLSKGKILKKEKVKLGQTIYKGRFYILQSGNENNKDWIKEQRNVLEDYKTFFGEKPRYDPILIGILTDSNDTKSVAKADYDDILIKQN